MTNALILGGTGMVGRELVKLVLSNPSYTKLTLISRRPLSETEISSMFSSPTHTFDPIKTSKLNVQVVDFEHLDKHSEAFKDCQVAFCTMGTTIADAGSAANFIKVDHDYPLNAARIFLAHNPGSQFMLLTAQGSKANSWFLYPRTKGLLEEAVSKMDFKRVCVFRPGLLYYEGQREKARFMEGVAITLTKGLGLSSYAGCSTIGVAKAMEMVSLMPVKEKVKFYENSQLVQLSK